MERIWNATIFTWRGLRWASRSEAAFRQEIVALLLAAPVALIVAPDGWRRAELVGAVLFVMIVELLNTAIEKLCDRIIPHEDEWVGRIKDMGSAAVGLAILFALVIWVPAVAQALRRG